MSHFVPIHVTSMVGFIAPTEKEFTISLGEVEAELANINGFVLNEGVEKRRGRIRRYCREGQAHQTIRASLLELTIVCRWD